MKHKKVFQQVCEGHTDANISFDALCGMLKFLGFDERIKGGHHIYTADGIDEIVNLQPRGSLAKPYQVKQIRRIIFKYRLGVDADDEI